MSSWVNKNLWAKFVTVGWRLFAIEAVIWDVGETA